MIPKMAWRNLLINKRRTMITLLGIAFGVMMAVLFTGLQDATWGAMIDMAARMGAGHVTVQHTKYLEEPSLANFVNSHDQFESDLRSAPHVTDVKARIVTHAMVATAAYSTGAMMYGIDPETEDPGSLSFLEGKLKGDALDVSREDGVILGAGLANNLEVKLGKKLVYTITDKDGEIVSGLVRVRGILTTGSKGIDNSLCLIGIDALRNRVGYGIDDATQFAVFLDDHRQSRKVAAWLDKQIHPNVRALPWQVVNPDLDGLVATKMAGSQILEMLIMFLIAAGIFNTLFVSVMERMREFGIMNAIGFSGTRIFLLIVWESIFTAIGGLMTAVLVTALPYYYLNMTGLDFSKLVGEGNEMTVNGMSMQTVMYVDIYPEKLLTIALVAVVATLLSGLYPAAKAGRVDPVDAIKIV